MKTKMENIYILRQKGVYWHNILFVSLDKQKAIGEANRLSELDIDQYHEFVVSEIKIDEPHQLITLQERNNEMKSNKSEKHIYTCKKPDNQS